MTQVKIIYVASVEIANGIFVVDAKTASGRWFRHEGPTEFAYFTKEQAERLEWRVRIAQVIDTKYWIDGKSGYYGTDDHEYALLETEYFERAA